MRAPEGLRPPELARVPLHFEVLVAFGAAEAEGFGVVAHEGDAFAGVAGLGAEVARFDPGEGGLVGIGRCVWGGKIGGLPHGCWTAVVWSSLV